MSALGVPIAFKRFREHHHGTEHVVEGGLPAEGSVHRVSRLAACASRRHYAPSSVATLPRIANLAR